MTTPLLRKWLLSASLAAMATFSAQAQYCAPDYGSGCANDDINDFYIVGTGTSSISDVGTGCSPNAYRNMSATMAQGSVYAATMSTSGFFDQSAEIYIDFNNDNVFSPSESVGGHNYVDALGTNMNINIPTGAPVGNHRMRIVLSPEYYYPGLSGCPSVNSGYEYGEVHDYTANIITGASGPSCTAPASLAASGTTANSTSIIWQPVTGALGYEYVINQTSGAPSTAGTFTSATTMPAAGLTANTVYFIHVRTKCNATTFSNWTELQFVTSNGNTCIAPGGLTATNVSNITADLSWAAVPGTQGYEIFASDVFLYPLNGTMWSATSVQFTGLTPNTTYYMWLRQHCDSVTQSDWALMTFTTTNSFQPASGISGNIFAGDGSVQTADTYMVWLINYDSVANTLTAVDSLITGDATYDFSNPPAGNYLVKAALLNGIGLPGLITQLPTYHDSSLYWNTAMTVNATNTSNAYIANIWMRVGEPTSGPGFVGGNVSLGANKGTASGVAGRTIVLRNSNGIMVKGVYTDANGNFSFGNLPVGTYSVYPEGMGYETTVATVNITSGQSSIQNINFNQDDAKKNIKPSTTGIGNVNAVNATVSLMPNPANNVLNISWSGYDAKQDLTLTITNSTGQTVLHQALPTKALSASIDVSELAQGVYFLHLNNQQHSVVRKVVIQR